MRINFETDKSYYTQPNFRSASDLTLHYILKHDSQYMPKRVLDEIKKLCASGKKELPNFIELHKKIYQPLMDAKTMEQVKSDYPEFRHIIDITAYADNRSKAIQAVREKMPLKDFTLQYLKDVYTPMKLENIVEKYGFTNRSIVCWLNEKLNIQKLPMQYIKLLSFCDEAENARIAELSRKAIYADAEAQKYRLQRAAEAHRTPEYKEKKRQEMIDFYNRKPEAREKLRGICQATWDKCPEIKQAMKDFIQKQPEYIRGIFKKKMSKGYSKLSSNEKSILTNFYKEFWTSHQDLKTTYRKARQEAIKELS